MCRARNSPHPTQMLFLATFSFQNNLHTSVFNSTVPGIEVLKSIAFFSHWEIPSDKLQHVLVLKDEERPRESAILRYIVSCNPKKR